MSNWWIPNGEGINPVVRGLDHSSDAREVPGWKGMIFILRAQHISTGEEGAFSAQRGRNRLYNNHHKGAV